MKAENCPQLLKHVHMFKRMIEAFHLRRSWNICIPPLFSIVRRTRTPSCFIAFSHNLRPWCCCLWVYVLKVFFDKEINLQGYVTTVHFPAASKCLKKKIGQFHQRILGQDFSLFFLLKIRDMYVSVLSICITFLYENWRISSQFM